MRVAFISEKMLRVTCFRELRHIDRVSYPGTCLAQSPLYKKKGKDNLLVMSITQPSLDSTHVFVQEPERCQLQNDRYKWGGGAPGPVSGSPSRVCCVRCGGRGRPARHGKVREGPSDDLGLELSLERLKGVSG